MLEVNEYFEGSVKSIGGIEANGLPATVGVMAAGEYTFSTADKEAMHVVSGTMYVKLPDSDVFTPYKAGDTFNVPADSSFDLKIPAPASYLCTYG